MKPRNQIKLNTAKCIFRQNLEIKMLRKFHAAKISCLKVYGRAYTRFFINYFNYFTNLKRIIYIFKFWEMLRNKTWWLIALRMLEQGVPWHSGNYRVWIYSKTRTWHNKNIQSVASLLQKSLKNINIINQYQKLEKKYKYTPKIKKNKSRKKIIEKNWKPSQIIQNSSGNI